MLAYFAAEAVVIIHLMFIIFVVFGGILVFKWRWIAWFHIPSALWGALIEFFGWICPLTPLEQSLRELASGSGYTGGFIDHYLMPVVYPAGLTRGIQLLLGLGVMMINLFVYGLFLFIRSKRREDNKKEDYGLSTRPLADRETL